MGTGSSGKRDHQKLKPYIVLQILQRETDADHTLSAMEIAAALEEMGIEAERRSIYRDIDEINKVNWLLENEGSTIQEAEEALSSDGFDDEKLIVYDKARRGFCVRHRLYDYQQIRLLAESVYVAKFLTEKESDELSAVLCSFVSKHQAQTIRHDALLTDRVKTNNQHVINTISILDDAMSATIDGKKHVPEKVTFKYLQRSISSLQQVERRQGERYKVSPYKLLINDGNYYLLAFDDKRQKLLTFRVDRMKDVRFTGEPRDGAEAFAATNLKDYTLRTFSMFEGHTERVRMRFANRLLDTAVERFGTSGAIYEKADEGHFLVTASVDVSEPFFGWLLGFGQQCRLLGPPAVLEKFKQYVDSIRDMY
jgi:predicted DNA-binding transcriptional regulator YafY